MPYEYRKLTPNEREQIVRYRKQHGYPRHAPPHPFRGRGAYLSSVANFEHKTVMKTPDRLTEFETLLLNNLYEIADEPGEGWLQEQWRAYQPSVDFGKGWDDDVLND